MWRRRYAGFFDNDFAMLNKGCKIFLLVIKKSRIWQRIYHITQFACSLALSPLSALAAQDASGLEEFRA